MKKQLLLVSFLMATCSLFSTQAPITLENAQEEFTTLSGQFEAGLSEQAIIKAKAESVLNGVKYVQTGLVIIMNFIKALPISEALAPEIAQNFGSILENKVGMLIARACLILQKGCDKSSAAYVFIGKMQNYKDTISRHIKEMIQQPGESDSLFNSLPVLKFVWSVKTLNDNERYVDTAPGSKDIVEAATKALKNDIGKAPSVSKINKDAEGGTTINSDRLRSLLEKEKAKEKELQKSQITQDSKLGLWKARGLVALSCAAFGFALGLFYTEIERQLADFNFILD